MSRRPQWHRIKRHRSYTIEEVAVTLKVCRATVRRWTKAGLQIVCSRKPLLIAGADIVEFGQRRKAASHKCQAHECYCVACRAPRAPAAGIADYIPFTRASGNLRAICPVCTRIMNKRVSAYKLESLRTMLEITIPHAYLHLVECPAPSSNVHLLGEL